MMTDAPAAALLRATATCRAQGAAADTITLAYEDRHRRRGVLRADSGEAFLLDLPEAVELREGDALVLEDGRRVAVRAAAESLVEIRADSPRDLARLAWHLGNRHLRVEVREERLLMKPDHVIEAMLEGLGARLRAVEAPFHPEGGAYGHGRAQGHAHPAPGSPHSHG